MVLIFSPSSNSTINPCEGIETWVGSRPAGTETFMGLNIAFTVICYIIVIIQTITWFILSKNEPYLQARKALPTIFISLSFVLSVLVAVVRKIIVDQNGKELMPCHLIILIYSVSPVFVLAGVLGRMIHIMNRQRFTELAEIKQKIVGGNEDKSGILSTKVTSEDENVPSSFDFVSIFKSYFFRSSQERSSTISSENVDALLRKISYASTNRAFLFLFFTLLLFWIIPVFIMFGLFDVYHGPCVGCDMSAEMLIALLIPIPISFYTSYRLEHMLAASKDFNGIFQEQKQGPAYSLLFYFVCWLFKGLDIGLLDYSNVFAYEWFYVLGSFVIFFSYNVKPIIHVLRSRKSTNIRVALDDGTVTTSTLMEYLTDEAKAMEFEKFMKERFALENVRFLEDILGWRDYYSEKSDQWRRSKAKLLIQTYIKESSLMEINISSETRHDIQRKFHAAGETKSIPFNLFEAAFSDIFQQTLFQHFALFYAREVKSKQDQRGKLALSSRPGSL